MGSGTGLGLATVYGIMQQSQGHIDVTTEPGRGTSFDLLFPATVGELAAAVTRADGKPVSSRHGIVLVVEDQPQVRELVVGLVESVGYSTLSAADGKIGSAIASAAADPILLVITDVVMPRVGGLELVRAVRQSYPLAKAVFVSGYADPGILQQIVAQGDAFLQKPFMPEELIELIQRLIAE